MRWKLKGSPLPTETLTPNRADARLASARVGGTPSASRGNRRRFTARHRHTAVAVSIFIGPFFVLFVAFYIVPVLFAVWQSLQTVTRTDAFSPPVEVFGGLTQYFRVFTDTAFFESLGRVLLLGVVQVPLTIAFATIFAMLLDSPLVKGKAFFRLGFFAPYAVPSVVAAIMWTFLYSPSLSPLPWLAQNVNFLGSELILASVGNIGAWLFTGWIMLVVYSALQAIPQEQYEAAYMDGASQFRIAWSIKLPAITPALVMTGVFSIIGVFQLFNEPQVLASGTGAVPGNFTPNMIVYSTLAIPNYNLASAYSVVLALATCIFSFGLLKFAQRRGLS